MRFTVGGQEHELTAPQIAQAAQGITPEAIQKHLVELHGTVYPPKQLFALATGRPRQSFTTQEAQRVLSRLGFVCREEGVDPAGRPWWVLDEQSEEPDLQAMDGRVEVLSAAVADLARRLAALEKKVG